jgi:WD40 repeat protein
LISLLLVVSSTAASVVAQAGPALVRPELVPALGHSSWLSSVAISRDGKLLLTGGDNTARLWDVATGAELRVFKGGKGQVYSVAFSPDGQLVLTGNEDGTARLWNAASGRKLQEFAGHSDRVTSVAFSPDGEYVVTGSDDETARLWDAETGAELRVLKGHSNNWVSSVAFSPDGKYVVTGSGDETARLWDAETGAELRVLKGHSDSVVSVAFSPNGQHVVTGSMDITARLWDVERGVELRQFVGAGKLNWVESVALSPDGQFLVTGLSGGTLRLWGLNNGAVLHQFTQFGLRNSWAFSPDGQFLVTIASDKTAQLWDVSRGVELRAFRGHPGVVSPVAFSPDGKFLVTGSRDKTVRLWDVNTGAELKRFAGHARSIESVAFSPNGQLLVSGEDRKAHLWDVETGDRLRTFEGGSYLGRALAFSPNGKFLVTGGGSKAALLWDVATGNRLGSFEGDSMSPRAVAFSPNGRFLVTVSYDQTARLWDVATMSELLVFVGHSDGLTSVAFSADGRFVITGSQDQTARLWDVAAGNEQAQLISFDDGTWAVIDPAGRFDASNGGDIDGLHWVAGLEVIKLSQLKDRYYEPGLLPKILGIKKESVRDVRAFSEVALYPELSLQGPTKDRPLLDIKLRNRGGGLGRVWVAINGKEIATDARGDNFDSNADMASIAVDLTNHPYLVAGADNTIEVKVYNNEGYLASRGKRVTWRVPGAATSEAPELWAVIAGVSDYSGDTLDLKFAAKDAAVFGSALRRGASRLFGAERVHLVHLGDTNGSADMSPTRDNLALALQGLANAKPTDVVLVYLAGHGITHGDQDGDYYFLTQLAASFDLKDPAVRSAVALSSDELIELIKLTPANKQVLILDTCAAGRVVELSESRGVPSSQIRALERMKDRMGFFVLAGSAADAVSYEASAYGQGLLTYSLLEGMRGAALREDEYLDVIQWFGYAADRVPEIAENIGGIQRPKMAMPKGTGSFDVARLTEVERAQIELQQPLPFIIRSIFQLDGPPIDPLDLTPRVNTALRDVSSRGTQMPWVFVDTSEYVGGYQLSGRYSVNSATDEVIIEVYLLREDDVIATKRVTGTGDQMDSLVDDIIAVAVEEL